MKLPVVIFVEPRGIDVRRLATVSVLLALVAAGVATILSAAGVL